MLDMVVDILARTPGASAWRAVQRLVEGEELFLIGGAVDMRRSKEVSHLLLTVYTDFEDAGERYRGSMSLHLHPGQSDREVRQLVLEAVSAARFVRNAYYPLVEPGAASGLAGAPPPSGFGQRPLVEWLPELAEVVADRPGGPAGAARVNSAELFLQRERRRVLNSQGVDVSWEGYDGYLELIVEAGTADGEVELYKELRFAELDLSWLRDQVTRQLRLCADRAAAGPLPTLEAPAVLITGEAVRELFEYYLTQTAAESVYSGISRMKVGESVQGPEVRGDRLSMRLEPYLPNSVYSAPWDDDGFALTPVVLVENGVLRRLWGPQRFCYYLGVPPTGSVANLAVGPGSEPLESLRAQAQLEVAAFSDFQVEPVTGDFGAEIRLAYLHPGAQRLPVTGGSVSGNLRELQGELHLSRELERSGNFEGPQGVRFPRLALAGVGGSGQTHAR